MEPCINYDQYDAFIHGYDYHTGFPKANSHETNDINILNSYQFMLQFNRKEHENAKVQHEISQP